MKKHSGAIASGEVLNAQYQILKILGAGGFGITYQAYDIKSKVKVAIKEYFPSSLVYRLKNSKNIAINSPKDKKTFEWGLSSFIKEAQILAKLNHKNIVNIDDFFEENNTAYFVMPYVVGISLGEYINRTETFSEIQIYNIIMPILEGLKEVHENGILHRDIKPDNILICKNKAPLLLDFGAAKDSIGKQIDSSKMIVSPPFTPVEQYGNSEIDAPYTDIYAVGMVLYVLMTKKDSRTIPTSIDRSLNGEKLEYPADLEDRYSTILIHAMKQSLEVEYQKRPQDIDEMISLMLESPSSQKTLIPWMLISIVTPVSAIVTFSLFKYLGE